jgi:glutamyl-tRNA synthetase
MTVVTRFAPSPTGFLHIGGARTALFNWLFARHHGGKMLLRVEDTDRARSTDEAVEAIYDGMRWLGLDWDGDAFSQFARMDRHGEVARQMVTDGHAYYCYCTPEELQAMRDAAKAEGKPWHYDGRWRDRDPSEAPAGIDPVIRLKSPLDGETTITDMVQGTVTVSNTELDDLILLRSDGTPTYMLAVVVDDHDMGVTDIIRGDDHFTNAFRQTLIFQAMGWKTPNFAHIPLIHGPDGAKLSKRHGALGIEAYRDMGYLPAAMRNYLVRLGWSHGDDEVFSTDQAIEWFTLDTVGKSPARFDFDKLAAINASYIQDMPVGELAAECRPFFENELSRPLSENDVSMLPAAVDSLRQRAKTLVELSAAGKFYFQMRPLSFDEKAVKLLDDDARNLLSKVHDALNEEIDWQHDTLQARVKGFAEVNELKLGKVAQPLRAALTGTTASPGIFDVMAVLGKEECLGRIADVVKDGELNG